MKWLRPDNFKLGSVEKKVFCRDVQITFDIQNDVPIDSTSCISRSAETEVKEPRALYGEVEGHQGAKVRMINPRCKASERF